MDCHQTDDQTWNDCLLFVFVDHFLKYTSSCRPLMYGSAYNYSSLLSLSGNTLVDSFPWGWAEASFNPRLSVHKSERE